MVMRFRLGVLPTRSVPAMIGTALAALSVAAYSASTSRLTSEQDYAQEKTIVTAMTAADPGASLAAVKAARSQSRLASTQAENDVEGHLANLLRWVVRDYAASGSLRLLSALPEGRSAGGNANARTRTLQQTFWLQDNSLYGAGALLQYSPVLGRILSDSWRSQWEKAFPRFCPDTQSEVAVGMIPAYETGSLPSDSRCRLRAPADWQYLRMRQYPNPAEPGFDSLKAPIIGTDYPADPDGTVKSARISKDSPRDLLKYGCLRQVLLGHPGKAREMFDAALARWDGEGFIGSKNDADRDGKLVGIYWTRDLAFLLMCANALGEGDKAQWGTVAKAKVEQKLWSAQSQSGGIWSNYCASSPQSEQGCPQGIPSMAKQTNEIAPLVLLAYGGNIWARQR